MKKTIIGAMLVGLILSSGCASMLSYNSSKKDYATRVARERAMASGDQAIVKAVGEGNYLMAGIDLADPAFWDVMAEHPIRGTLAAVVDLATAAAATWAITSSVDNSHHDTVTITVNGNGNTTSYNNGQSNTVKE